MGVRGKKKYAKPGNDACVVPEFGVNRRYAVIFRKLLGERCDYKGLSLTVYDVRGAVSEFAIHS